MAVNKKKSREDFLFNIITYTVFSVLLMIFAYPFYYLIICTISNNQMVNLNQITLVPVDIHFENYIQVFKLDRIYTSAGISALKTVIGTVTSLLMTSYMAYFFTKTEMRFRTAAYRFVIATMYFTAGMVPVYLNIKMLNLMNSFWVYIIPSCMSAYNMILVKTSMEAMPASLEEAAEIDGATYWTRFFRIVLPLQKPILATVGLFSAVAQWNNIFDTKLYITNTKLYSLQFVLWEYYNQIKAIQESMTQTGGASVSTAASSTSIQLTMTVVTVIPIMLIYPFIQKYYMKGVMIGAVKG